MKICNSSISNPYQQSNIPFTSYSRQKKYGIVYYDDNGHVDKYELLKPHGILEDLEHWKSDFSGNSYRDDIIDFIKGSKVFLDEKIFSLLGEGFFTVAFDIGNDKVLKISDQNPFEFREHNPRFDIPLLSPIYKYGDMYGYIQAKADKKVSYFDVLSVKRKIKRDGYKVFDFDEHPKKQIGIYEGKSYLLDSRCAIKQNNIKTRFAEWLFKYFYRGKKECGAIAINPTKLPDTTPDCPIPNYSKKEVYTVIKNVIKSWVK